MPLRHAVGLALILALASGVLGHTSGSASDLAETVDRPIEPAPPSLRPAPSSTALDYTKLSQVWAQSTNGGKLAWSADVHPARPLVARGQENDGGMEVRVMDAASGATVKEFEMNGDVNGLRFSPDGRLLAMGGASRNLAVVETANWTAVSGAAKSIPEDIRDIAWSQDSRYLFVASGNLGGGGNNGRVSAFDSSSGWSPVSAMEKTYSNRPALSIDSVGGGYAVGVTEGTATPDAFIYQIPGGQQLRSTWVSSNAERVRFDSTGAFLAIGRGSNRVGTSPIPTDADVLVWDTSKDYGGTGARPHVDFGLHANGLALRAVDWSPDSKAIVSGGTGTGDQLRFWHPSNGTEIAHYSVADPRSAAFSPSGLFIFLAHEKLGARWGDTGAPSVALVGLELPDRNGSLFIPRFVKAETAHWVVTFDEDMDTSRGLNGSFGPTAPYDQFPMRPLGWRSPREWVGEFVLANSTVPEGAHAIRVKDARDASGNVMNVYQAFEWVLDMTGPTIQINPLPYWRRSSPTAFPVAFTDPPPSGGGEHSKLLDLSPSYLFSNDANASWSGPLPLNSTQYGGAPSFTGNLSVEILSSEGHYKIKLSLRDRATNEATVLIEPSKEPNIGFDVTPPKILKFGSGKQWSSGTTVDLPYEVTDGVGLRHLDVSAWFSPDGVGWSSLPGRLQNLSGLSSNGTLVYPSPQEGWYRFDAFAVDESGLVSANASSSVAKDLKPPESSLAALPPLTNDPNLILKYTASDSASGVAFVDVEHRVPGGQWALAGSGGGTNGQVPFKALSDGLHEFRSIAQDVAGNREGEPAGNDTWTILDTVPPAATPVYPPDGSVGVPTGAAITATLSEPVDLNTITAKLTAPSGQVPGSMKIAGLDLTFTPSSPLAIATKHIFTVVATDVAGNQGTSTWGFTTAVPPDGVSPRVTGTSPEHGAVVSALSSVRVTFDEPMSPTILESPSVVPGTVKGVALSADKRTLSFGIDPVTEGTTYTVTISASSARDASGEALDGNRDGKGGDDFAFSFLVSAKPGGSIRAVVLGVDQKRLEGATVALLSSGTAIREALSDAKGEAVFADLIPGEYGAEAAKGGDSTGVQKVMVESGKESVIQLRFGAPPERPAIPDDILLLLPFIAALTIGVALAAYFRRRNKCPACRKPVPSRSLRCPSCGFYFTPQAAGFFDSQSQARVSVAMPAAPPPEVAQATAPGSQAGWTEPPPLIIPATVSGGPELKGTEKRGARPKAPPRPAERRPAKKREVEVDESEPPAQVSESTFNPYKAVVMRVGKAGDAPKAAEPALAKRSPARAAEQTKTEEPGAAPSPTPAPKPSPPTRPAQIEDSEEEVPPPPPDDEEPGPESPLEKARRRRRERSGGKP